MQIIKFTQALKRFYPDLGDLEMEVETIEEVINQLDQQFKGIKSYILDDQGVLRQHVNIFINGKMIEDRDDLSDAIAEEDCEIFIMQALSGG